MFAWKLYNINICNLVFLLVLLSLGTAIANSLKPNTTKELIDKHEGHSHQNRSNSDKIGYQPIILVEPNEELHINQTSNYTRDLKNKHQKIYDDTGGAKFTTSPIAQANTTVLDEIDDSSWIVENKEEIDTRRILYSKPAKHPHMAYMVYLQLNKKSAKINKYKNWLCGGVIIHKYYVLTSAACVEDADHFYAIAGTSKWANVDNVKRNKCICKHRRRVIWKCTPKRYRFDFRDSEKWAANDLAIVRVETAFNLNVKEKYCEYATELIAYNNISAELEMTGTKGFILGWGTEGGFREGVYRRKQELVFSANNSNELQIAKVIIMDKELCAKKWAPHFRDIIRRYMICTRDILKRLSLICDKNHAKCKEVGEVFRKSGRFNETLLENNGLELKETKVIDNDLVKDIELEDEIDDKVVKIDLGRHIRDPDDFSARRMYYGGFCENDHGGPLVVNYEGQLFVIGIISTCKIHPSKHVCHGPFLYTSVFNNNNFIACSMYKELIETCRKSFRSGVTHDEWTIDWAGEDDEDKWTRAGETAEDKNEEDDDNLKNISNAEPHSLQKKDKLGKNGKIEHVEAEADIESIFQESQEAEIDIESIFQEPQEAEADIESIFQEPQEAEADIESIFQEPQTAEAGVKTIFQEPQKAKAGVKSIFQEPQKAEAAVKSIFQEPQKSTEKTLNVKVKKKTKPAIKIEFHEKEDDVNDPMDFNYN